MGVRSKSLRICHVRNDIQNNFYIIFCSIKALKNITALLGYSITNRDVFLEFELGGSTLSKSLFEIKGQFFKGERVYQVRFIGIYWEKNN